VATVVEGEMATRWMPRFAISLFDYGVISKTNIPARTLLAVCAHYKEEFENKFVVFSLIMEGKE